MHQRFYMAQLRSSVREDYCPAEARGRILKALPAARIMN